MTEPLMTGQGETDSPPAVSAVDTAARSVSEPSVLADFWGRLRHHKVMQWTLAYAAAAYTLLHGVEMLSEAQDWPHGIVRVFSLALILGIPVVITLAWYHGAKGLKRFSGAELTIITILLLIAGSVLWWLARSKAEEVVRAAYATTATAATAPVRAATASPAAPRTAVAVLPFANLTGDASKEYLGDGMAEELINTLTKVRGLKVPARTSSFAYKGRNTDIRQIAKDLGVGTLLEGSVRAAGKRIRITAQLINAQDGLHLWSETYDEEFTDLFKLQDKLATEIARALQPNLGQTGAVAVSQALPTNDVEAYRLYLQGSSLLQRPSERTLNQALGYFEKAIARDPGFARAYDGVASAHEELSALVGVSPFENTAAAERAAEHALSLDPTLASAQFALAGVNATRGNWLQAEFHARAAVEVAATDGFIRVLHSSLSASQGRIGTALQEAYAAYELAPANPIVLAARGWLIAQDP